MRIIFVASGSTARRPSAVATAIGKKQTRATTASFGPIPKPNQTTRIGAKTMIGIAWEPTISG